MRSIGLYNWRQFLITVMMWLGTASFCYALKPVTVDIKPFADGYVTARADGMLTWTDMDGNPLDSVRLKMEIAGIEVKDGRVIAVSPDCRVLSVERDGRNRQLCRSQMTQNGDRVTGIACTQDNNLILTEAGVILSTADFDTFTAFDFNGTYSLYYRQTCFCSISASDNSFCIAGTFTDGMPAVFTSATGKIWSERSLTYTLEGQTQQLEQQPLGLAYDRRGDRFVMSCTDGCLFYMPGCSHCNSMEHKSMRDIVAVAFNDGHCLIAED